MEKKLFKGINASPGISIGKVYLLDREKTAIPFKRIESASVPKEISRFEKAVRNAKEQLTEIKKEIVKTNPKEHAYIIDAHIFMLEDDYIIGRVKQKIASEKINVEKALKQIIEEIKEHFQKMDDPYLKERGNDIVHLGERLFRNLMGVKYESVASIPDGVVVVAHDLSPADTAQMSKGKVLAFATDVGGRTSHTAIMARSLEIPAVVGLEAISKSVENGSTIIVDGTNGIVIVNPDEKTLKEYKNRHISDIKIWEKLLITRTLPAVTLDGHEIKITGNIELPDEAKSVIQNGGQGIGLYRTEFLYLSRKVLPSQNDHYKIYKEVIEAVYPKEATIRTLDIGGDKFLSKINFGMESNPVMGLRAIRFCLKETEIFKNQLKGILQASIYGNVKILFPLISGIEEIRRAKEILNESKHELTKDGIPFKENIPVGAMIEVPSAALIADILAKEVDFFSIGTNDLIQYFLAIDRVNEHVAYLYEPMHPAILRILKQIINSAKEAEIEVGMCGEMAGEPAYTAVLIGLGINFLSMNALSIPVVKNVIRNISLKDAKKLVEDIFSISSASEIEKHLKDRGCFNEKG